MSRVNEEMLLLASSLFVKKRFNPLARYYKHVTYAFHDDSHVLVSFFALIPLRTCTLLVMLNYLQKWQPKCSWGKKVVDQIAYKMQNIGNNLYKD